MLHCKLNRYVQYKKRHLSHFRPLTLGECQITTMRCNWGILNFNAELSRTNVRIVYRQVIQLFLPDPTPHLNTLLSSTTVIYNALFPFLVQFTLSTFLIPVSIPLLTRGLFSSLTTHFPPPRHKEAALVLFYQYRRIYSRYSVLLLSAT